jgi:ribosome-associated translation inhibitor RaiA
MAEERIPIDLHIDLERFPAALETDVVESLGKLSEGHSDMIGAMVSAKELASDETPHRFQTKVVVYLRPDNVVAEERADNLRASVKGALTAVERQVRDKRERLGEPWKRPDVSSGEELPPDIQS